MRPTKYNKGKKPPAFISNLYKLLEDTQNHNYAKWTDDQESFIILNISKFSEIVLPKYYKHSNYSSFVRQLNMYNFNKMRSDNDREHIFKNQMFVKDRQDNLKSIKRRQITNSNSKINSVSSLAQAINEQMQLEHSDQNVQIDNSCQYQNQIIEVAAPSPQQNFFTDFPNLQSLKLLPSVSEYLQQIDKIPPIISLKPQTKYFPLKTKIDQMKSNQYQLEEICISLYKQNQILTGQNKRLQQKLKNQFKRKEQILTQIIKYVVNFLSEWNSNNSQTGEQKQFHHRDHVISEEQSSSDPISDSYDMMENRKFQNKSFKNKKQSRSSQKGFTFSKYAQNQKKILLTLLQQIQKSYGQKFFFTNNGYQNKNQYDGKMPKDYARSHQNYLSSTSANSFLMSMLLEFIESNNLVEVLKRFSLLINLERNKKSKNFTVVNCMKDLKEHFKLKQLEKFEKYKTLRHNTEQSLEYEKIQVQQFQRFVNKQRFLQNEKETIKQMQKQLALITKNKSKSKELNFLQHTLFESQDHQSSYLNFNNEIFIKKQNFEQKYEINEKQSQKSQFRNQYFNKQKQENISHQLLDLQGKRQKQILEKFNFRLE